MTNEEVIALFRIEMHDVVDPSMFADAQLYAYLDDAQKMFARNTGGIPDSTSSLATISYAINDSELILDQRILKVRAARLLSDGQRIEVLNYEDMDKYGMRFDGKTGPVRTLIIGMDETTVYPYPVPSIADSFKLVIDRMPLYDIVNANSDVLELASYHHLHLLDHMKALAYGNQDAEVFSKSKALEHEERFTQYCVKVTMEKARRKHKTRVVQYGGLPIGSARPSTDYRR